MKFKLLLTIVTLSFFAQSNITAGYESTTQEETQARAGSEHDADITATKEEIVRMQPVDEAYSTKNQEEFERQAGINEAHVTSAAEEAARS